MSKLKLSAIAVLIAICVILTIYCGIAAQYNSEEKLINGRYILIDKVGDTAHGFSQLVYDKDTYIMYVFNNRIMSPYYIVKDKEAIVAIYNVNWFEVNNYE